MKSARKIAVSLEGYLINLSSTWNKDVGIPYEVSINYLIEMCGQIIDNPAWEVDKAHRWIGYIQGVMVCRGLSLLDEERTRVREIEDENPPSS